MGLILVVLGFGVGSAWVISGLRCSGDQMKMIYWSLLALNFMISVTDLSADSEALEGSFSLTHILHLVLFVNPFVLSFIGIGTAVCLCFIFKPPEMHLLLL